MKEGDMKKSKQAVEKEMEGRRWKMRKEGWKKERNCAVENGKGGMRDCK